jgi:hypothetical protein
MPSRQDARLLIVISWFQDIEKRRVRIVQS